jgi:phosphatidylserine/phosphatidylglycerophosphate/cardiolipin synthase-like enzyme
MKHIKKLKAKSYWTLVAFLFIGFGTGYTVREFYQPPQITHIQPETKEVISRSSALISACFTPGKHCQLKILEAINSARKSIHVQAYSFTDPEIANALVSASKRGLTIKVILDKSNMTNNRSARNILIQNGIPLRFDAPPGISHNKIIILDYVKVITGSYNFSQAAYKSNAENVLFIQDKNLAEEYSKNWLKRWEVSFTSKNHYPSRTKKRALSKHR